MESTGRPLGRFFCFCVLFALLASVGLPVAVWAAPQKTNVVDILYRADGTPAHGTVTIRFGQSRLSREANNYFGLKAHGAHACVAMATKECDATGEHSTRARFAAYASMEECFADRDRVIATCGAYAKARECATDVSEFVTEMAKHWATDPDYAEKLMSMLKQVGETEGK